MGEPLGFGTRQIKYTAASLSWHPDRVTAPHRPQCVAMSKIKWFGHHHDEAQCQSGPWPVISIMDAVLTLPHRCLCPTS